LKQDHPNKKGGLRDQKGKLLGFQNVGWT